MWLVTLPYKKEQSWESLFSSWWRMNVHVFLRGTRSNMWCETVELCRKCENYSQTSSISDALLSVSVCLCVRYFVLCATTAGIINHQHPLTIVDSYLANRICNEWELVGSIHTYFFGDNNLFSVWVKKGQVPPVLGLFDDIWRMKLAECYIFMSANSFYLNKKQKKIVKRRIVCGGRGTPIFYDYARSKNGEVKVVVKYLPFFSPLK